MPCESPGAYTDRHSDLLCNLRVAQAQLHSGFAWGEWGSLTTPLSIFLVLSGYCYYRYRETRAMTMGLVHNGISS